MATPGGGGGGDGRGSGTQIFVYQKWPGQIFPVVKFVFSQHGHRGEGINGRPHHRHFGLGAMSNGYRARISLWDIRFLPTGSVFTFFQTFLNFCLHKQSTRKLHRTWDGST